MNPKEKLEIHIRKLIKITPSGSDVISCFVNLEHSRAGSASILDEAYQRCRRRLGGAARVEFDSAFAQIRSFLDRPQAAKTRGAAIYVRSGNNPFFLSLEFAVPLQTEWFVDDLPHIYPLIALKDTYHRFVTVITTEQSARIFETTLGAITDEVLTERRDLRQRIGREWTRDHYQNHKHEKEQQLIREKIQIIDELMTRGGHNHLVVAGSPTMVGRLTAALPPRLKSKLISTKNTNPSGGVNPILLEAIDSFVEAENRESHDRVRLLRRQLMSNCLAVAGYEDSLSALEGAYADMLVLDPGALDTRHREHLLRQAATQNVEVETVVGSEILRSLGGVGCLLRYRPHGLVPTQSNPPAVLATA